MNHAGEKNDDRIWTRRACTTHVTLVLLILGGGYYFLNRPAYLDLDIEPPMYEWAPIQKCIQTWSDSPGCTYILRKESSAYKSDATYNNWQAIRDYFHQQLIQRGWTEYGTEYDSPQNVILPESEFLPYGEEGILVYRKEGFKPYADEPTVCLAIWYNGVNGYHIVLATANPSFLHMLGNMD